VSLFQSISARSAGLTAVPSFGDLAPGSQFLLLILMFIGSAAASTGGGITIGAFAVVVVAIWSFARGAYETEVGGRTIPAETVRKAFAVWITSLAVVLTATFLILITHDGVEVQRVLFEVVSAFGTTGLSLGFTSQLNLFGQILIGFVMFWGRLGALTIVVALARERRPPLVSYPEDQLLIG
ncbi:MAG: potassium transporter, partial [Dehalococcoidia bacterium]|nr:potassium transporter [Dehalococcoidia bacterium]